MRRLVLAWFALAVLPALIPFAQADERRVTAEADAEAIAIGQRMYREGILPSGEPMHGSAQGGVERSGREAACAACHRRSGFGSSEGQLNIRPITGPALLQLQNVVAPNPRIAHQLGVALRPPYDDAALARAIRDGVDASGGSLSPLMPRYALTDAEIKPLAAYLKTLSAQSSPGVDGENIHLATVIQPGVEPARRQAMLDIIQAFVKDKNAGTRSDVHRREAGAMRMHRSYRTWVLHVWQLTGSAETWGAQLEVFYREQPVFAMVSGLGNASWRPIHDFSERFEVPCVFPQVDLPVVSDSGFYTLYLSKGILLEADVLAKYLREKPAVGSIVQVYGRDERGVAAAREFRVAMNDARPVVDRVLEGRASESFWTELAGEKSAVTVVSWLPAQDLATAAPLLDKRASVSEIYLSSTLLGGLGAEPAFTSDGRVRVIYPLELPAMREPRMQRAKLWLRARNIPPGDEKLQINTYFAVTLTGDVLSHLMDSFSRDFFVERVEHEVTKSLIPSIYPRVSLGPGQRFASKGSYIIPLAVVDGIEPKPMPPWIVP